jgi:hypothetical protein
VAEEAVVATRIQAAATRTQAALIRAAAGLTLAVVVPMRDAATAEAAVTTAAGVITVAEAITAAVEAITVVAAMAITDPASASALDSTARLTAMDMATRPLAARPDITISTEIGFPLVALPTRTECGRPAFKGVLVPACGRTCVTP